MPAAQAACCSSNFRTCSGASGSTLPSEAPPLININVAAAAVEAAPVRAALRTAMKSAPPEPPTLIKTPPAQDEDVSDGTWLSQEDKPLYLKLYYRG